MFKVTELWSSFKGVTKMANITPRLEMFAMIFCKSTLGFGNNTSTFKPITFSRASILSANCLCCRETHTISQSLDFPGGFAGVVGSG